MSRMLQCTLDGKDLLAHQPRKSVIIKERSKCKERKKPLAPRLTPVKQWLTLLREKGVGNILLNYRNLLLLFPQYSSGTGADNDKRCGSHSDCRCRENCRHDKWKITCNMLNSECPKDDDDTVCCCESDKRDCRMLSVTNYIDFLHWYFKIKNTETNNAGVLADRIGRPLSEQS